MEPFTDKRRKRKVRGTKYSSLRRFGVMNTCTTSRVLQCLAWKHNSDGRIVETAASLHALHLRQSGPKGRKHLAGGVSPRSAGPYDGSPGGATAAPLSPLRGLRNSGPDSGGLRPRLCAFGPSGLIKTHLVPCNDSTVPNYFFILCL